MEIKTIFRHTFIGKMKNSIEREIKAHLWITKETNVGLNGMSSSFVMSDIRHHDKAETKYFHNKTISFALFKTRH